LETKIKRQKQKKNVSKYFTRDANKMSGFKQLKKKIRGVGWDKITSQLGITNDSHLWFLRRHNLLRRERR
jgi:hypothetical protein